MKRLTFFLLAIILPCVTYAQRTVALHNLWTRPQVHVFFEGYRVSFAIRDINRALEMLRENGDSTNVARCNLDTSKDYNVVLQDGTRLEYRDDMQPLLQNVVGAFLLTAGRAEVEVSKHKLLKEIVSDVGNVGLGGDTVFVRFTDPATKKLIFSGIMPNIIYGLDMGMIE